LLPLGSDAAGSTPWIGAKSHEIAENYGAGRWGRDHGGGTSSRASHRESIEKFLIQRACCSARREAQLITAHAFKALGLAEPARDPSRFFRLSAGRGRMMASDLLERIAPQSGRRWNIRDVEALCSGIGCVRAAREIIAMPNIRPAREILTIPAADRSTRYSAKLVR